MRIQLPTARELKFQAKKLLIHPLCFRVTIIFIGVQLLCVGLRYVLGGTLGYYLLNLADYANTATGIYATEEGWNLIFRMDLVEMVIAIPLAFQQIRIFLLLNVVLFVLLAPLRLGATEQYWLLLKGEPQPTLRMFRWYVEGKRFVKALLVEGVLRGGVRLIGLILMIPSGVLYYQLYTKTTSIAEWTAASSLTQLGAVALLVVAGLLTFWIHSLFLPVRYCLAAHPEFSLGETFQRGLRSVKGFRRQFYCFRLSFLLWFGLSQVTYSAMDFYVTPYSTLSGMMFLQEAARVRKGEGPASEVPPIEPTVQEKEQ